MCRPRNGRPFCAGRLPRTCRTISSSRRSSRPTGPIPKARGAAKFYLDRLADPNLLTRDVGRMFLGRDLQCAQCHDHPLIDDYKQAHYYGIFAFLNRTTLFEDDKKVAVLAEKAEGDVTFTSVFKKKVTHKTGPRILDGPAVTEPSVPKGAEYLVAPGQGEEGPADPPLQPPRSCRAADVGCRPRVQPQHRQPALGNDDGARARAPGRPAPLRKPARRCRAARSSWPASSWPCTTTSRRFSASWP